MAKQTLNLNRICWPIANPLTVRVVICRRKQEATLTALAVDYITIKK